MKKAKLLLAAVVTLSCTMSHAHDINNWLLQHKYAVVATVCVGATALTGYMRYAKNTQSKKLPTTVEDRVQSEQVNQNDTIELSLPVDLIMLDDIAALRAHYDSKMQIRNA
jgi:hypothetical protein